MSKRIIIKTALICFGIFLILNSIALVYIFKKYPPDMEKYVPVVVAAADIEEGTVIENRHVKTKLVQQAAVSNSFLTNVNEVIGKKAGIKIDRSDYLRSNDLVEKNQWFREDDRIIVLPVSIEERMANLIRKGSYIDIGLRRDAGVSVESVLTEIKVQNMLDESGTPLDSIAGVNSRTAYMELVLDKVQREKIYAAITAGKLIYELYCENTQS